MNPYDQGYDACCDGEPDTANPYDPNADEYAFVFWLAWDSGWCDAANEADTEEDED